MSCLLFVFELNGNRNKKEWEVVQMATDTLILMALLFTALSWWITIHLNEERQFLKQCSIEKKDELERAERVRNITNKL